MNILLLIRLSIWSLLIVLVSNFVLGCQVGIPYNGASNLKNCQLIKHGMGETKVCGQPQRIVALGPYVLEPLVALGFQPVGFADHVPFFQGDYTDPKIQIPYLGSRISAPLTNVGIFHTPSMEGILKLKPDLILGIDRNNAKDYQLLSNIAPTLLLDINDAEGNLRLIAKLLDRSAEAEAIISQTRTKLAIARQAFQPMVASSPNLLLLVAHNLDDLVVSDRTDKICGSLLQDLNFNLVSPLPAGSPSQRPVPISLEVLPQLNQADLVIVLGRNFSGASPSEFEEGFEQHQIASIKQAWKKNAIAQSLNASKNGKVYFIPAYLCLGLKGAIGTELYLNELTKQLLFNQ